jgi:kynurenine formamidase
MIAAAALAALPAAAQDLSKGKWVDLTHAFNEDTIYWPTAQTFKKERVYYGRTPGGWFYAAYNYSTAEHGGTHMDSPIHFAIDANTTEQVSLDQLIGPGFVIDVTAKTTADPDYLVTAADIEAFEAAHGRLPEGAIVLLRTGWGQKYGDVTAYMGTAERGEAAVAKLRFPGLSLEGAKMLVRRQIGAVGIDTASIDRGQSKEFAAHVELMTHNIPAFENVADMSALPPAGATIIALPMKIEGGSGGPLRIVAHLPGG